MHPDVSVDLVDSRRKRCVFLRQVTAQANRPAPIHVVCARIEELDAGAYDGVTARALASPPKVLELARRLLVPGGRLLLLCAEGVTLSDPSFTTESVHDYTIGDRVHRALVMKTSG